MAYAMEDLQEAAARVDNMTALRICLGMKPKGGGNMTRALVRRLESVDTSHWSRQPGSGAHGGHKPMRDSERAGRILRHRPGMKRRQCSQQLRWAMRFRGFEEVCSLCGIDEWMGERLLLDIDHIDGDWRNNQLENLRFLCPNCHRQTPTWGYGNKG